MKGLGWVANTIAKPFLKDKQKGTIVGNALAHAGHELEELYLESIGSVLKAGFPNAFPMEYQKNNELGKAAKQVYIVLLMAAGVHAGMSTKMAASSILQAYEGGMTAVKAAEAAVLAGEIASA